MAKEYTETVLDRAAHLRKDVGRLMASLDTPATLLVPLWRGNVLTSGGDPRASLPSVAKASRLIDAAGEIVWLGQWDGHACFALDLSALERPLEEPALSGYGQFHDLKMIGGLLPGPEADLLATARAMLHWHGEHRHCGGCGAPTKAREGGHMRECPSCGRKHFPRTDPAVMVLIARGDRCLLARQAGWPAGMYSVIAGFVEPGERLEEAAAREAREELGVAIRDVSYFRSQPWPFPCSMMIGFTATADTDAFQVDGEELEEARWFGRKELDNPQGFFVPPPYSLAHHLIARFVESG